MNNTSKIVLGTLAGLTIGAIAGILFAPEKGSKTRKKIMDKGNDYMKDIKSTIDSVKNGAEELLEEGKEKFEEVKKNVKNSLTDKQHSSS